MTAEPYIKMRKLLKIFELGDSKVTAVNSIDLDIPAGSFTVIMGPSGSGKSTLLYMRLDDITALNEWSRGTRINRNKEGYSMDWDDQHLNFLMYGCQSQGHQDHRRCGGEPHGRETIGGGDQVQDSDKGEGEADDNRKF